MSQPDRRRPWKQLIGRCGDQGNSARGGHGAHLAPTAATCSRGSRGAGVLEQQDRRIERDRASKPHAAAIRRHRARDRPRPRRLGQPTSRASARRAPAPTAGGGSISSVNGIARFWITVSASSSTARSLTMPNRSTVASQSALSSIARRRPAEHADLARVGQRRAGREVHEHFRATADRSPSSATCSPAPTRSCRDPQRAQSAIVLDDAGELEHGGASRAGSGG